MVVTVVSFHGGKYHAVAYTYTQHHQSVTFDTGDCEVQSDLSIFDDQDKHD